MAKSVELKNDQAGQGKPVILFHGDKGGVGKSWMCSIFTDWLVKNQIPVALVDGDTRNPDVSRMFGDLIQVTKANLREHDGWMEVTDFMHKNADKVIVISMPAGIGGELKTEAKNFVSTVTSFNRPLAMFWVINRLPDSVNLLNEAMAVLGENLHAKFVVKNLFFGNEDKFTRWDASDSKVRFEKSGGVTLKLGELNERVVDKLFADNANIMPFSTAVVELNDVANSPHGMSPSENQELLYWIQDHHKILDVLKPNMGF